MKIIIFFTALAMLVPALIIIIWWKKKFKIPFYYFLWGMLSWVIMLAPKIITALLLHPICIPLIKLLPDHFNVIAESIYQGLYTGVFESGIILLIALLLTRIRTSNWEQATAFGIGHGIAEALILGTIKLFISLLIFIPEFEKEIPEETKKMLLSESALIIGFFERIIATCGHIYASVLVLAFFLKRKWKWFWISFFYYTLIDSIAGFFINSVKPAFPDTWQLFLLLSLLPLAIIGVWGTLKIKKEWAINTANESNAL